jgi:hypothetical protein
VTFSTKKQRLGAALAVALLVSASSALAAVRPDDRPGRHGVEAASIAKAARPDDRAGLRTVAVTTKTPLAGPWYTPQELKALIAYSNASFAQKKAILAGADATSGETKNGAPFTRRAASLVSRDPASPVIRGEPKNMAPFTNRVH